MERSSLPALSLCDLISAIATLALYYRQCYDVKLLFGLVKHACFTEVLFGIFWSRGYPGPKSIPGNGSPMG